jgi:hypothetical protein
MLSSATAMTMIFLLNGWISIHLVDARFYLHDSDNSRDGDFDCLNYYARDDIDDRVVYLKPIAPSYQIIPFCRRDNIEDHLISPVGNISSLTFHELREKNVSNIQLIQWSVPIDLVERYQAFIENADNIVTNESVRIYNCSTSGRFGQFCHYTFNVKVKDQIDKFLFFYIYLLFLGKFATRSISRNCNKIITELSRY